MVRVLVVGVALLAAGCGQMAAEQQITVQAGNPLDRVKRLLDGYAKGQPVGSEAGTFDALADEVKKTDPAVGEVVAKGLADIAKTKGSPAGKAKALLAKLK